MEHRLEVAQLATTFSPIVKYKFVSFRLWKGVARRTARMEKADPAEHGIELCIQSTGWALPRISQHLVSYSAFLF